MSRKILLSLISLLFLGLVATIYSDENKASATETSCHLEAVEGRYIVEISQDRLLANQSEDRAKIGPISTSIPAGNYKVTLASYDNHSSKPDQNQSKESWYLTLYDNGSTVASSNPISDLPEGQDWFTQVVNDNLNLASDVSSVIAFHNAYPDSGPESVAPICAGFDRVVEPTPTPEPSNGNGGNGDNGDNGDKPDCSASSPTASPSLDAFSTGPNSIMLTWNSVGPITHYQIRYGTSPGNYEFGATDIGSNISFEVKELSPGVTYYFQITGVNDCAAGHWSNEASATTGGQGKVLGEHTPVSAGFSGINFKGFALAMAAISALFFATSKLTRRFYIFDR